MNHVGSSTESSWQFSFLTILARQPPSSALLCFPFLSLPPSFFSSLLLLPRACLSMSQVAQSCRSRGESWRTRVAGGALQLHPASRHRSVLCSTAGHGERRGSGKRVNGTQQARVHARAAVAPPGGFGPKHCNGNYHFGRLHLSHLKEKKSAREERGGTEQEGAELLFSLNGAVFDVLSLSSYCVL